MATGTLILHKGARLVEREVLEAVKAPEPTETWFPVTHGDVYRNATETLRNAGYRIRREQLALSANQAQFFGTLDLEGELTRGVSLAVGLRNSIDQTLPLGFCAGNRVFVCDNLSFGSELLVKRKHTRFGQDRFAEAIALAVGSLASFQVQEAAKIELFRREPLSLEQGDSVIVRAFEADLIPARALKRVIAEYHQPSHDEFLPLTRWRLLNAFTEALKPYQGTSPQESALRTISFQALLQPPTEGPPAREIVLVPQGDGRFAPEGDFLD
jgi:hypothetical protein